MMWNQSLTTVRRRNHVDLHRLWPQFREVPAHTLSKPRTERRSASQYYVFVQIALNVHVTHHDRTVQIINDTRR